MGKPLQSVSTAKGHIRTLQKSAWKSTGNEQLTDIFCCISIFNVLPLFSTLCGYDNVGNESDAESETAEPVGDDDCIDTHSTDTHNSELAALTGNQSDTSGLDSRPNSSFSFNQEVSDLFV